METDGKRTAGRRREKKACRDESRVVFGPGGTYTHTQPCTDDSKWNSSTKEQYKKDHVKRVKE